MYKEEELKRLHAVGMGRGYGEVGFKYDDDQSDKAVAENENSKKTEEKTEDDEPFVLDNELNVPPGIAVPETKKLNAIIEKTALFISSHGTQMEILLKAKQAGNSQFDFLSLDCPLHAYYRYMVDAIKHHSYAPSLTKTSEHVEAKQEETDNYLHPSLAAPPLQAAPSIPSIHYKPSADCDYTMLITKIRGTESPDDFDDDEKPADIPRGELAPPGTVPLTLPHESLTRTADPQLYVKSEISKGPVMYVQGEATVKVKTEEAEGKKEIQATTMGYDSHGSNTNSPNPDMTAKKSMGLNLMHYYNSDSASESDSSDTETSVKSTPQAPSHAVAVPPAELQLIIDKMAAYVARNGDSFESTVRARNDPRFSFLESDNKYYAYYKKTMASMCKENNTSIKTEEVKNEKVEEKVRSTDGEKKSRTIAPVSFSIKKLKEPEPVLPKPALPYESSSEEEDAENSESKTQTPKPQLVNNYTAVHPYVPQTLIPPSVIYKIDASNTNLNDDVKKKTSEKDHSSKSRRSKHDSSKDVTYDSNKDSHDRKDSTRHKNVENNEVHSSANKTTDSYVDKVKSKDRRETSATDSEKHTSKQADVQNSKSKDKKDKTKHIEARRSSEELTRHRSAEIKVKEDNEDVNIGSKEKAGERSEDKEEMEDGEVEDGEIIMVDCDTAVESPTEFIDLTGDVSDDKTSGTQKDSSQSKRKQMERKRRAAAFLAAVQRGDGANAQPAPADVTAVIQRNTLASVMVKTLCDIQAKKDASEEQKEKRKHKKRKHHRSKNQSEESSKEENEENSRKERHKRKRKLKHADRSPSEQYSHRHRDDSEQHEKRKKKKDSSKESSRSKKSKRSRSSSKSKKERKRSPTKIAINDDNDVRIEDTRQAENADCIERKEKKDDKLAKKTSHRKEKAAYSEGEWEQDSGGESDIKHDSASSAGDTE